MVDSTRDDIPLIVVYLRFSFHPDLTIADMRAYWEARFREKVIDDGLIVHWAKEARIWANTINPVLMQKMLREYEVSPQDS